MAEAPRTGAVVIGRNEGRRLVRCLASVKEAVDVVVYVDSGSTDGSICAARDMGAHVVEIDTTVPFTAARARNAGLEYLIHSRAPEFVQFLDGDCELRTGWIEAALVFLETHPQVAMVCGRRRERFPQASVYNRLCDREWDTPAGETLYCGGDVFARCDALRQVDGYDAGVIAGEEPELCVRLRSLGWKIWRLDREMTWHDAAMTRFSQWWQRARRGGHAYAEGAAMHGGPPHLHFVREKRRALIWAAAIPALALLASFISAWALLLLLVYPLQVVRLAVRNGLTKKENWISAFFLTLSKFPELHGICQYHLNRMLNRRAGIIEYK